MDTKPPEPQWVIEARKMIAEVPQCRSGSALDIIRQALASYETMRALGLEDKS